VGDDPGRASLRRAASTCVILGTVIVWRKKRSLAITLSYIAAAFFIVKLNVRSVNSTSHGSLEDGRARRGRNLWLVREASPDSAANALIMFSSFLANYLSSSYLALL
jgi:hypothetical protein